MRHGTRRLRDIGEAVLAWTGNHAGIIDFAERDIEQMREERPPILGDLQRDGIDLAGAPLRDLLAVTR